MVCVNMVRKSKVETSPHYNEIVDLLVAGYTPRYVSNYLSNEYNEKISYVTLHKYRKNNLNVKAAVKQKIIEKEKTKRREKSQKESQEKSAKAAEKGIAQEAEKQFQAQESLEVAADYRFKDIKKLDDLISQAESLKLDLDEQPSDPEKHDIYKEQKNKLKLKELGLKAIKLKYELIDDDETTVNIVNENNDFDDDLIEELINETHSKPETDSEE